VTTSPAGTSAVQAGVGGAPGTTALYPLGTQNDDTRLGVRLRGGATLVPETGLNLEGGVMIWASQASLFSASSDGSTILARPYTQQGGVPQSILVAFPGVSSGNITGKITSGNLYEANLGVSQVWCDWGCFCFGTLIGYRFYNYNEGLAITQNVSPLSAAFVPGTQITSADSFTTTNQFHGCNIGARGQFMLDRFTVGLLASVAAGNLHREVNIRGVQTVSVPGAGTVVNQGGVYALGSNIGRYSTNDPAAMSEVGVNLAWQATPNLRLQAGYTLLVLGQVATVGTAVDHIINTNLLPPATQAPMAGDHPSFALDKRDVWAHALSLGAEFVW
jgi:hypothetical protein